jgi:CLIP-associating protein 1/2
MALHVAAECARRMSAPDLLARVEAIGPAARASFSSALVDLRKAAVFLLVECYLVVGDGLSPHVQALLPQQRKLLTIYIEKQLGAGGTARLG